MYASVLGPERFTEDDFVFDKQNHFSFAPSGSGNQTAVLPFVLAKFPEFVGRRVLLPESFSRGLDRDCPFGTSSDIAKDEDSPRTPVRLYADSKRWWHKSQAENFSLKERDKTQWATLLC